MPTTMTTGHRHRRERPGKLAARVSRLVRERRRLLAIREQIDAAFALDMAELQRLHREHRAHIDAQLRELDHGLMPQPGREQSDAGGAYLGETAHAD